MSEKKPTKRATRKPKAIIADAEEWPKELVNRVNKLLKEPRIQRIVLRIKNEWNESLLEDEDARLEYIRSGYEELLAEFIPRIAVEALETRYGIEAVKKTLGDEYKDAPTRWRNLLPALFDEVPIFHQEVKRIDEGSTKWKVAAGKDAGKPLELVREKVTGRIIASLVLLVAEGSALALVESGLKRGGTVHEAAKRFHLIEGGKRGVFVLGTSPLHLPMTYDLLRKDDRPENIRVGRNKELLVRTEIDYEQVLGANFQNRFSEERLQQLQTDLIKQKGIGLLKVHLDLQSEAYRAGGDGRFPYDFKDALERQGYSKNDDRRGYHRDSMRNLRQNIHVLGMLKVTVYEGRLRNGKTVVGKTPYWISTLEHSEDDNIENLLGDKSSDYSTGAILLPGEWWTFAKMNRYRMEIPQSILELPVDDHKNRTNLYVLLLASYLAVHVRRNQEEHAGKKINLSVGIMLEQAGIITRGDFMRLEPNQAKRERDYLETTDERGALSILARLQAFKVDIHEEEDFFATGKGWKERFWNAMLRVDVPNLGIRKRSRSLKEKARS